jgi:hypothetical protein
MPGVSTLTVPRSEAARLEKLPLLEYTDGDDYFRSGWKEAKAMNARACRDATHGMTYFEELCILIAEDKVTEERPNWTREALVARLLSIQHRLNPLHVYCRLLDRGISKKLAMAAGKTYELLLFISLSFLIKTLIHFRLLLTHQGLNRKEAPTCPPPPSS